MRPPLVGSLHRAGLSAAWLCPQAQNELIWNIKDELKKACSTNDLKELLIFNKQQVPSGESAVSCPPPPAVWEALRWDARWF